MQFILKVQAVTTVNDEPHSPRYHYEYHYNNLHPFTLFEVNDRCIDQQMKTVASAHGWRVCRSCAAESSPQVRRSTL